MCLWRAYDGSGGLHVSTYARAPARKCKRETHQTHHSAPGAEGTYARVGLIGAEVMGV